MVLKSGGSSAADAEMIAAKLGTEDERWCELRSEHAFQRASCRALKLLAAALSTCPGK